MPPPLSTLSLVSGPLRDDDSSFLTNRPSDRVVTVPTVTTDLPPPDPAGQDQLTSRLQQKAQQGVVQVAPPASRWPMIGTLAGVGVGIGSLLPWVTVISIFGSISVAGTQGDGKITLGLAVAVVIGFLTRLRWLQWLASLGALAVGGYDLINVSRAIGDAESEYVKASTGYGLYIAVGSAVLALVAAYVLNRHRPSPT